MRTGLSIAVLLLGCLAHAEVKLNVATTLKLAGDALLRAHDGLNAVAPYKAAAILEELK